MGLEAKLNQDGFLVTKLDAIIGWARKKFCLANAYGYFLLCYWNDGMLVIQNMILQDLAQK